MGQCLRCGTRIISINKIEALLFLKQILVFIKHSLLDRRLVHSCDCFLSVAADFGFGVIVHELVHTAI